MYPPIDFGDGSEDGGLGKCPTCDVFLTGGVSNGNWGTFVDGQGRKFRQFGGDHRIFCPKCRVVVYEKVTHGHWLGDYRPPAWWPGKRPEAQPEEVP